MRGGGEGEGRVFERFYGYVGLVRTFVPVARRRIRDFCQGGGGGRLDRGTAEPASATPGEGQ